MVIKPSNTTNDGLNGFPNLSPPLYGLIGFSRRGYVFQKNEEEKKFDVEFVALASKMDDIFSEVLLYCSIVDILFGTTFTYYLFSLN